MERLDKMFSEDLLNKVKEILDEGKKQVDEAVEVSHTRYLRSHGKKASGRGPWMFTHKLYGDAKGDDTFAAPSSAKSFSDATKHAKEWAKSKGHRTVYVMEEVEQIDEVSPKSAINAYIRRKSRADDFYSEPDDEEKAEKTLSRIDKKYGSASKIAKGARHGVEIDQKGRGHQGGPGDYLDAKQGVYKGFAKPTTKKGTKQRLDYMNLNKGRFKEEVEQIDEAAFDAASKANDRHYEKQTERVKNMLDKYAMRGMSYRDAVKKISGPGHILRNEITPLREEAEDLDEGRGRPPKEGSEAWKRRQVAAEKGEDEGESEHIIASLRKASHNMTGRGGVKFKSGIEMVDREHARRAVANYMDKRTPDEKDEYLDKISHSYGHLKKNI